MLTIFLWWGIFSPASPTKETVERPSLFCQSILAKTVKTPDFLHESSKSGAFCIYTAILTCLQGLLPIFLKRVSEMAAPIGKERNLALAIDIYKTIVYTIYTSKYSV